jgi:hypothetical protein
MNIETTDDLCNQLADWIGVYGSCTGEESIGCNNTNPLCCRTGFMMEMQRRIYEAVENDKKLNLYPQD